MSAVHRSPSGPPSLPVKAARRASRRSEEHTSELQSQSNLVCRLLLEKKKTRRECATGEQLHRYVEGVEWPLASEHTITRLARRSRLCLCEQRRLYSRLVVREH